VTRATYGVASPWPSSVFALDFVFVTEKLELQALIHPIPRIFPMYFSEIQKQQKTGTGTVASC
jgi:hypothetical protein